MLNRWYSVAVVAFWLTTMSWLVVRKVLPPLLVGEPPSYQTIVKQPAIEQQPVNWEILLDGKRVGEAVNRRELLDEGVTRLESRVLLERLPLGSWPMGRIASLAGSPGGAAGKFDLDLETHSTIEIDPLGRLVSFEIVLRLGPLKRAVVLLGSVDVDQLTLHVRCGDFSYETTSYLSEDTLIGDALSPQPRLPGLKVGQSWTMPVYSPLAPQNRPVEILQATVKRQELLPWNGAVVRTLLVTYRQDTGAGLTADAEPQARAWVRADGAVLQQEVQWFGAWLRFVRREGGELSSKMATEEKEEGAVSTRRSHDFSNHKSHR